MASRKRKFEFYKLTISGLTDGTDYRRLIFDIWRANNRRLPELLWQHAGKTHGLRSAEIDGNSRLRMRFYSFKTGYRPDVIDLEDGRIEPNPMSDTQTGVDYTHALLDVSDEKRVVLLEKTQPGLHPVGLALYLNWLFDNFLSENDERVTGSIVVSIEPEVDSSFVTRINNLSRILTATIRVVQPNPGWADLDSGIAVEAQASHAARADLTMGAKRGESLAKNNGIVAQIKNEQRDRVLGYARIDGVKEDGTPDVFTSTQMVETRFSNVPIDGRGQAIPSQTFAKMTDIFTTRD